MLPRRRVPTDSKVERTIRVFRLLAIVGLFLAQVFAVRATDFDREIAPILSARCIECHNSESLKGGLDLTSKLGLERGGESGGVLSASEPLRSLLLQKVFDGKMPPPDRGRKRPLRKAEQTQLRNWVAAGSPWPAQRVLDRFDRTTDSRAGRDWWSLQPIERPPVPRSYEGNVIDYFVNEAWESNNLTGAPPASKRQLIRRAAIDLTGLPPSYEDVEAFRLDTRLDAYERLLDRLLSSPEYGERWARYWLDLVRFAETDGYERDRLKAYAWRYRDWVIDALNRDMPYDQFVIHQLAGDEIPKPTEASVIATGMLRVGTWNDEPNDPQDYLYERLEDMVHTTSSAFLGLTIKCARCHDHKFDPIEQKDYYRVASYFWAGYTGQANQGGPSYEQLGFENVYGWTDRSSTVSPIRLLLNGERHKPGDIVKPEFPSFLPRLNFHFEPPPEASKTTKRRLQFARWITAQENPLTPRVIVNRIWKHHFGEGLVRTPNNFGFKSDPPTHPRLLDWLAAEFVEPSVSAGIPWSLKRLHKLIMLSKVYRQGSLHPEWERHRQKDSANRMLWHFPRLRMDAEALRDNILMASGSLNRSMFGPSFFPEMSKEALEGLSRKEAAWQASPEPERMRRSIYMMSQRSRLLPLMTVFDFSDTTRTCAKRDVTTVAPQALALLNNSFVHHQSQQFAKRLMSEAGEDAEAQITRAWAIAFQRLPSRSERDQARAHLETQVSHFHLVAREKAKKRALESLCHVLLNANEFLYVD